MPSSRSSRTPLSRDRIVRAALDLIDAAGLDALSMRALADELGTRPMSLYRHVADKDAILDGVMELLLDEVPATPAAGTWSDGLRGWARGFRGVMRRHPRAVPVFALRPMTSYAAGRASVEHGLRMLEEAGFDPRGASLVLRSVVRHVVGFSLAGAAPAADAGGEMPARLRAEGFPRLAALVGTARDDEADELFLLGLDALVDGLALRLGAGGCSVTDGAGHPDAAREPTSNEDGGP